jgi:hypothetical protein
MNAQISGLLCAAAGARRGAARGARAVRALRVRRKRQLLQRAPHLKIVRRSRSWTLTSSSGFGIFRPPPHRGGNIRISRVPFRSEEKHDGEKEGEEGGQEA